MKNLLIVKMENSGGTKHTGVPVKTLKKLLKKAGLKVSGKKATLTRRAKKAKLFGGAGGIGAIKGMPAVVLSPEQQKAKDANDAYQKQLLTDKNINAAQKEAIDAETKSRVTTTYEKPSLGNLGRSVLNAFTGTGKNKRSRRR